MAHHSAMKGRGAAVGAAATLFGLTLILAASTVVLGSTRGGSLPGMSFGLPNGLNLIAIATFPAVGIVIAWHRPENPIWLLLCGLGLTAANNFFSHAYAIHAVRPAGSLPLGPLAAWVSRWAFGMSISLLPFLLLLFPTGRLATPRWRWLAWLAGTGTLTTFLATGFVSPGLLRYTAGAYQFLLILAALIALVVRFRRSTGDERLQLKWFTYAAALAPVGIIVWSAYFGILGGTDPFVGSLIQIFNVVCVAGLAIAIGIAILKYHLYDIDLVINRTFVYGSLAVFITFVYVAIVVGIGAMFGTRGSPNLALSIVATAVAALAFQPMREALQRIANRLVYGKRASPYEILAQFSEWATRADHSDAVLPRMARILAEGTAAARAGVWIRVGSQLRLSASFPADGPPLEPQPIVNDLIPPMAQVDRVVPVRHQGELLGALSLKKRSGESLTATEEKLVTDLAAQAGLVLKNVHLTAELMERLEELQASRTRLVTAQDAERQRIERDLHDGLQQELVAMLAKVRIARTHAVRDPGGVDVTLEELSQEIRQALKDLRELARGIRPPILSDQGLVKAIKGRVTHLPIEVAVDAEADVATARYPEDIEGAAYFFVCEGLANVMKHACATSIRVHLSSSNGNLQVEVIDDGTGFDLTRVARSGLRGLEDRIEAVGGTISVGSRPGGGTRLVASLPVRRTSPV